MGVMYAYASPTSPPLRITTTNCRRPWLCIPTEPILTKEDYNRKVCYGFTLIMTALVRFLKRIPESIRERRAPRRQRGQVFQFTAEEIWERRARRRQRLEGLQFEEEDIGEGNSHLRLPKLVRHATTDSAQLVDPRLCLFCLEEKESSAFPSRCPTDGCTVFHQLCNTCTPCLSRYITSSVESNPFTVKCFECNSLFMHKDMKEFASPETFQRYDDALLRKLLDREARRFRWCPNPSCSYGEEHEGPDPPCSESSPSSQKVTCSSCGQASCFLHRCAWHNGKTCEEFDEVDPKTQKLMDKKTKSCPACKVPIKKNGGCNHMTCRCGNEFCWVCLQNSIEGHGSRCPARRTNPPVA